MKKQTLRSLLLSYQKKDWFFWYDTDYDIYSEKIANYKSIVAFIPKEGLAPPYQSSFWYHTNKDLKARFSVMHLKWP